MKHIILECDVCHTRDEVSSYKIDCGVENNITGDNFHTIWNYKELCVPCYTAYILEHSGAKIYPNETPC
jgi:hypothetical protein